MDEPAILVCDDHRPIAQAIAHTLRTHGFRPLLAANALEAVSLARKELPRLILMDVMMPGLDGAMAAELLHDAPGLENVPVVLLSAMPEEELRVRAAECGARGWLAKPFTQAGLLEAVRSHLGSPAT